MSKRSKVAIGLLAFALLVGLASEAPAPTRRTEAFGDFIGNYNFRLEIGGVDAGQFTAVDGLSIEQEVVEYRDGGDNLVRKLPGRLKYGDITLKRGFTKDTTIWAWIQQGLEGAPARLNGTLTLQVLSPRGSRPAVSWGLTDCFPRERRIVTERDRRGRRILQEVLRLTCNGVDQFSSAPQGRQ